MFVFSRRAVQERLHALASVLDPDQGDALAVRLNTPGGDRLAAMWEVIFLHAFSQVGNLKVEQVLANGKRPDVAFTFPDGCSVGLVADITAVSDEGLDKENPIQQLYAEIAREARKAGLPPGGISYRTESRREPVGGGDKVFLRLPSPGEFPTFLKDHIRPFLRQAKIEGAQVAPLVIDTPKVSLSIAYDGSQFSTGSYPSYDHATSLEANPIMNRLKGKASGQLKDIGLNALKGVIVCDADCANMRFRSTSPPQGTFSPEAIARKFLQTNTSFDFVIFATVRSERQGFVPSEVHTLEVLLITLAEGKKEERMKSLCLALIPHIPTPIKNITNAALRCREEGVGENSIGGYHMSCNHVRVSARALMDVLSGKMSVQEWESEHKWSVNPFLMRTMEGRGIVKAELMFGGDKDDDDIEFTFGSHDAAMAPFTARKLPDAAE